MIITPASTGWTRKLFNGLDGADVTAAVHNTHAFWENTLGWGFITVWKMGSNNPSELR
ncbi:MAG: hypothetical protein LBQ89_02515 [Treponema sp.]|jgi:hypothetical protein|nr:hypothetical protein [Treponema sp.]